MVTIKEKTRTLRSNNNHLLKHPKTGKNLSILHSFTFAAPQSWNELPEDVKLSGCLGGSCKHICFLKHFVDSILLSVSINILVLYKKKHKLLLFK